MEAGSYVRVDPVLIVVARFQLALTIGYVGIVMGHAPVGHPQYV